MKKSILEVYFNEKLSENDVLVYDGKKWIAVNKHMFLNGLSSEVAKIDHNLQEEVVRIDESMSALNDKLVELSNKVKYILGEDEDEEE